jgi:glycosyltransferase involved in cell wall biosynthesis
MTQLSISALIPVKNGSPFLGSFLPSLVKNMRSQDEIVFVNDHSEDDSFNLIVNYFKKYDKLKVQVINNKDKGLVSALNLGINNCSNNWIARFDVDDKYTSDRIESQRELINDETVAIFTDYEFFLTGNESLGSMPTAINSIATKISLVNSQRTPHPGALINKAAVKSVGSYQKNDFPAEDLSLWLRLAKIGDLTGVPRTLLQYNFNPNSTSFLRRKEVIAKKHELILKYGIPVESAKLFISEMDGIFGSYRKHQLPIRRELHSYNDLIKLSKYGYFPRFKPSKVHFKFVQAMLQPSYILELNKMNLERNKRKDLRDRYAQ